MRKGARVFSLIKPAHEFLGPAVLFLSDQVKDMDDPVGFRAVVQFPEQALQFLVVQVMDGTSKKNLVEFARSKRTIAEIGRDEMHIRSIAKATLCCFDRDGVDVHAIVVELGKRICDMTVRAAEIKEPRRRMELGKVELSFEFIGAQDNLYEIPNQRN